MPVVELAQGHVVSVGGALDQGGVVEVGEGGAHGRRGYVLAPRRVGSGAGSSVHGRGGPRLGTDPEEIVLAAPSERRALPRFGLIFVACPVRLDDEQKHGLVLQAARAWFERLDSLDFDLEGCRGTLRPSSELVSLGTFTGQRFTAEVHTPEEHGLVEFLVAEKDLHTAWTRQVGEA